MRIEGLYASCSPSFDPLTDRPFTHPQRYRDILLLPTRLFQLPRSFASFFSPIGFLWCSHTSYLTTLYFPLPRSVRGRTSSSNTSIRASLSAVINRVWFSCNSKSPKHSVPSRTSNAGSPQQLQNTRCSVS